MLTSPRTALASALGVLALTATSLFTIPAHADPCEGDPKGLECGVGGEGGGNDGGGTGNGNGNGNGNGQPPPNPDNDDGGDFPQAPGNPAPQHVPTAPIAEQSMKNVPYPVPKILTAPPNKSFVRIKTAFWIPPGIDEPPPTAKAHVGGPGTGIAFQEVTAQATVGKVDFSWSENGEEKVRLTCEGKGRPKGVGTNGPACEYIFKYASVHEGGEATEVTATIHWVVTWTCVGDCDQAAGGNPDIPADPPAALLLPIDEIQTESN